MVAVLHWVWRNRAAYWLVLFVLLGLAVGQSVQRTVSLERALIGPVMGAVGAYLMCIASSALTTWLRGPQKARDIIGGVVAGAAPVAIFTLALYQSSGPGQVTGNGLALIAVAAAAGAEGRWRRLEQGYPSFSRPAPAGAPQEP